MPQYKLTYFDITQRAEVARWIFAYAKQEYIDERIQREHWPAVKPKTPFGQMPVLSIDGVELCQSYAIARYLAKQFGLAGKTPLEEARVDMVADCANDARAPVVKIFREQDPTNKEALMKQLREEHAPYYWKLIEELLKSNNGGDGFFVGDSVTWADFIIVILPDAHRRAEVPLNYDDFPKLKAHKERVEAIPQIAEWIKKRPPHI